jgi:hypothetical protein
VRVVDPRVPRAGQLVAGHIDRPVRADLEDDHLYAVAARPNLLTDEPVSRRNVITSPIE